MKYLLDTNALLYMFGAPSELSARARRIIRDESDLSVSDCSPCGTHDSVSTGQSEHRMWLNAWCVGGRSAPCGGK